MAKPKLMWLLDRFKYGARMPVGAMVTAKDLREADKKQKKMFPPDDQSEAVQGKCYRIE
jgi:hypothetical protein